MKLLTSVLVVLILTGCASAVPIAIKFPDVPTELMKECPDLKTVDPASKKLSEILEVVVDNYGLYYDCKATTDDWIEWYKAQKQIFNNIK
jgi:hypothetical protein